MLELEHVPLHEGLPDLLVGPGDEHLVVVVGLLGEAGAEVDRDLEVHALPVGFQQDAKFLISKEVCNHCTSELRTGFSYLCPAKCKYGYEDLPSLLHAVVHLLEEVPLAAALGITDGGGVRGLGDQQVRTALVNPGES